ncbi:MAG: hypothetical protein QG597_4536 [Actinomycetota bacterium]|nr:hypothetical protein [Actinomycetota bacterium]
MTFPFRLLHEALTNLSLPPDRQRQELTGTVVTDELALDLDYAVSSLNYEMDRTGVRLDPALLAALSTLNDSLTAPPTDEFWDAALDDHPVWATARATAAALLAQVPLQETGTDFTDTP